MSSLEDSVLDEVTRYYSENDIPLDQWVGPYEVFPEPWDHRLQRRVLYQLADKGVVEERSGKENLHYAIRPKMEVAQR